jgi:type IV secretory pathway TraG/TraD family ATPase VirD4
MIIDRNPSSALDSGVATPAFSPRDLASTIGDRAAVYHGGARFLTSRELMDLPELSQPDPKGTGFSDLAGEVMPSRPGDPIAPVFLNGPGVMLIVGAPGGGKSSLVTTQLLRPRRDSFIVLDLKGELYERSSDYLRQHMDVHQHGLFFADRGAGFNPLAALPDVPEDATHLSAPAVRLFTELGNLACDVIEKALEQPFWVNNERGLFVALAGHVKTAALAPDDAAAQKAPHLVRERTMAEVYRLLLLDGQDRKNLIVDAMDRSRMPWVRAGAMRWKTLASAKDTYAAVQSDLLDQLSPWVHPVIEAASRECSYSFSSLRQRPTAIFLRVPPAQMALCKPWLRSYFGTAIRHLMYDTAGCGVTIYLDEAALLGTMESFDQVVGAIRGYRIRLNAYYQSIGQLRAAYPKSWETWLSTSFAKQFFSINDVDTGELVSRSVGDTTVATPSFQVGEAEGDTRGVSSSVANTSSTSYSSTDGTSWGEQKTAPIITDQNRYQWFDHGRNSSEGGSSSTTSNSTSATQTGSGTNSSQTRTVSGATQWTFTRRRLIDPTEVMTLPDGMQVILTPRGPILARMARFFENPDLLARARPDGVLLGPSFAITGRDQKDTDQPSERAADN